MKTPRVILKGLVSGRVKLTPQLLETLKKYREIHGRNATKKPAASADAASDTTSAPDAAEAASDCRHRRMIFASPLPGRWIKCSGLLMVSACLMLPWLARAAGTDSTFDQANRAFAEGKMSAAARGFQSVLATDGFSAPALYNLANAQFRDGQIGPAILNYERAHWLAPNDPDITANLEFARRKAGVPAGNPSRVQNAFGVFSLNAWASIAALMVLLLAAMPVTKRLVPNYRVACNSTIVTAAFVFLIALVGVSLRWSGLNRAIITAPETAARVSPVTVVQPLFTLHAGETVTLKKIHGAFALVINEQGHEGWISRDAVAPVVPMESQSNTSPSHRSAS